MIPDRRLSPQGRTGRDWNDRVMFRVCRFKVGPFMVFTEGSEGDRSPFVAGVQRQRSVTFACSVRCATDQSLKSWIDPRCPAFRSDGS